MPGKQSAFFRLIFILGMVPVLGQTYSQESSWSRCQNFNSPARLQAVGFSIGEKGYIATGSGDEYGTLLQDLQEYDPGTNSWSYKTSLPVSLRGSAAFTLDQKAYVTTGGSSYGLNYQLLEWDRFSNSWSSKAEFPSGQGRMAAIGVSLGNRGYVGTGFDLAGRSLNDLWEYDPYTNSWSQKAPLPGSGRCYAISFTLHDKIYIGLGNNGTAYLNDWWEYTPSTNSWRRMEDFAGGGRTGAMGFSANGKGYIVGGVDYTFKPLRDVWKFDPIQNTWTQLHQFPGMARGYGVSFVINSTGYIAAGTSSDGYLFDIWKTAPSKMGPLPIAISISRDDPFTNPAVISPNPFFYRFFLKMRDPYTGLLELTVSDMGGRVVFHQSINKDAEYIVRFYEIDYLPDGLFVFRIRDPSGRIDTKQTVIHKSFGI